MVLWVVVGCSSKSGKQKGLGFFRMPKIITNQGKESEELATRKRNEWISAVSHGDATNKRVLESERALLLANSENTVIPLDQCPVLLSIFYSWIFV